MLHLCIMLRMHIIAYAMETFALDVGFWPTVYHNQFSCENCIQHGMIQLEKVDFTRIRFALLGAAHILERISRQCRYRFHY